MVVSLLFWFCVFGCVFFFCAAQAAASCEARASHDAEAWAAFRGKETKETPPNANLRHARTARAAAHANGEAPLRALRGRDAIVHLHDLVNVGSDMNNCRK